MHKLGNNQKSLTIKTVKLILKAWTGVKIIIQFYIYICRAAVIKNKLGASTVFTMPCWRL